MLCVCITIRPLPQVIKAWDSAPFAQSVAGTRRAAKTSKGVGGMRWPARTNGVEIRQFTYDELISFIDLPGQKGVDRSQQKITPNDIHVEKVVRNLRVEAKHE